MGEVTRLLAAIGEGEPDVIGRLYQLLYPDLHRLAHARMRRSGDMTLLDTTGLLHESFLRLEKAGALVIADRGRFLAYAAKVMRSIVVDVLRRRNADRRGGALVHLELEDAAERGLLDRTGFDPREHELLQVNDALEELAQIDERLVQVVEMRYFAGLTEAEIAEALGLSVRTVARDWVKARLFLHSTLR